MCNKQDMIGEFLNHGRPSGPIITDAGPKIDFNKKLDPTGHRHRATLLYTQLLENEVGGSHEPRSLSLA